MAAATRGRVAAVTGGLAVLLRNVSLLAHRGRQVTAGRMRRSKRAGWPAYAKLSRANRQAGGSPLAALIDLPRATQLADSDDEKHHVGGIPREDELGAVAIPPPARRLGTAKSVREPAIVTGF